MPKRLLKRSFCFEVSASKLKCSIDLQAKFEKTVISYLNLDLFPVEPSDRLFSTPIPRMRHISTEMIVKLGFQYTPSVDFKLDYAICNLRGSPFLRIKIT